MCKSLILVLITFFLVACNGGTSNGVLPDADENPANDSTQNSLRAEALPTATLLPPTWTPIPMEHSEHLPDAPGSPSASATRVEYTVQRGDTLAQICNRYGLAISEVARINNISNWDHIEVGQILTLPISGN